MANKNPHNILGLKGFDPLTYFKGDPKLGTAHMLHEHDGVTYGFVDEANRDAFAANPEKYAPQFGGWCATAMSEGGKMFDIDPYTYKIQDDRLLVFYNGPMGNTLEQWEAGDTTEFLKLADEGWAKVQAASS